MKNAERTGMPLIREYVARAGSIGVASRIPYEMFNSSLKTDVIRGGVEEMVLSMKAYVLESKHEAQAIKMRFPANWWEHFKRDRAPSWFLRRWPVEYKIERVVEPRTVHMCPHADIPWRTGQEIHLSFLAAGDEK